MDFDVEKIIDLARSGEASGLTFNEPSIRKEAIPLGVVPLAGGGAKFESLKPLLDQWRTAPERKRGTATALTLCAFIELTKRHADEGSAIFAEITSPEPRLRAVLDYHALDGAPRYGGHQIVYDYPVSDEWTAWRALNGKTLQQIEFAAFIEDYIAELASPLDAERGQLEALFQTKIGLPTDIVTLSRGLSMSIDSKVKEVRNLQSGEAQIVFEEIHKDGAGQPLIVPGLFIINIPLFVGAEPTRIVSRLRYRRDGGLKWSFHLWRWRDAMRAKLMDDLDLARQATALPVFEGSPEK